MLRRNQGGAQWPYGSVGRQMVGWRWKRCWMRSQRCRPGIRLLRADEQVAAGDLVYNLLLCQWQDAESVLWLMPMVEALGGWASPVPIVRKAG